MEMVHYVPERLARVCSFGRILPGATGRSTASHVLGACWHGLCDADFHILREGIRMELHPLWLRDIAGTRHVYYVPDSVPLSRGVVSTDRIDGGWSKFRERFEPLIREVLVPHTSRGISVEAFGGDASCREPVLTYPWDTGNLRVCLHMGTTDFGSAPVHAETVRKLRSEGKPCPDAGTWRKPSSYGQIVHYNDLPVAEILGDHTVLVLPDLICASDDDYVPLYLLGVYLEEAGRAMRSSWPKRAVRNAGQFTSGATITIRLERDREIRFRDVPSGATMEEILYMTLGSSPTAASCIWVRVGNVPVRLSYVPKHGDSIVIEAAS